MKRLLVTGAGGRIGRAIRPHLGRLADIVRLSDIAPLGEAAAHEELRPCELTDAEGVRTLVAGCDGVIHLGGVASEDHFLKLFNANIVGLYHLYEAAREAGRPRMLFASTNHTSGFYRHDEYLDHTAPLRPDSLYGVSKCFGEALARLYFDKFGQETAVVRIGSCFAKPTDHRMLSTWISYRDFISLIECIFRVPRLGCPVVWGVSNNDSRWWDNRAVDYLGWQPEDNAERFRAEVDAAVPRPPRDSPEVLYQGGLYAAAPLIRNN